MKPFIHEDPHPWAGRTVRLKETATHPQVPDFGGSEFRLEDWWDRDGQGSWGDCVGNPACLVYAFRAGFAGFPPDDDEVVYGKIGMFGHIVHVNEIEGLVEDDNT